MIAMIDLHCHLDGSLPLETVRSLAAQQGIELPAQTPQELKSLLQVPPSCTSLTDYLRCFDLPIRVLQTPQAIADAAESLCRELSKQGILYAELRFAPQHHTQQGHCQQEMVEAALDGLARSGFFGQFILCCMRGDQNDAENRETLRLTARFLGKGVAAADLAGAEALFPTDRYAKLFSTARELDIPFTIHAGEAAGPESVRAALSYGAMRIGHGVRAIEDPALVEELARRRIPLELCMTSNLQTQAVPSAAAFPLRRFLEAGVMATINTDNCTVSGTSLAQEYALAERTFALTGEEIALLRRNAVNAAFLPPAQQSELLRRMPL
jgi:adenosine deaminase